MRSVKTSENNVTQIQSRLNTDFVEFTEVRPEPPRSRVREREDGRGGRGGCRPRPSHGGLVLQPPQRPPAPEGLKDKNWRGGGLLSATPGRGRRAARSMAVLRRCWKGSTGIRGGPAEALAALFPAHAGDHLDDVGVSPARTVTPAPAPAAEAGEKLAKSLGDRKSSELQGLCA